jgi:hypothetical protein
MTAAAAIVDRNVRRVQPARGGSRRISRIRCAAGVISVGRILISSSRIQIKSQRKFLVTLDGEAE